MEEFYPSEIARLVLGYLTEMKCKKSWQTFLEESSDLQEYFSLFKKGKVYSTKVNGKSLSDILTEYCVLKREALLKGTYQEQSSVRQNNQEGISADAVGRIIKNALDVAFQKYFPPACNSRLNDYVSECRANDPSLEGRLNDPVLDGRANDSDDSVVFVRNKTKKDKALEENNRTGSVNHPNIQLNGPETIATPTFLPNITNVRTVTNRAYNSMSLPEKELTNSSLLALQTVARMNFSRSGSSENCTIDSPFNSCDKESPKSSPRNKSLESPIVVKIEDEDLDTTVQRESGGHTEKASVQRKGCESRDSGIIEGESHNSGTASCEPQKNLPCFSENTSLSLEATNLDLGDIVKLKPNSEIINSNPEDTPVKQNSSMTSLNCKNVNFRRLLPSIMRNSVADSTANNPAGFSITSSSIPNQLSAANDLSHSSVPTYIFSNYPSCSQIVQNTPYQFVINTPVNGMPLTLPTVPVNSVSNPVFTATEPKEADGTSKQLVPVVCRNVETRTATLKSTKKLDITVVKESVKRKTKNEALPESKKSNCSEEASKTSSDSSSRKSTDSSSRRKSADSSSKNKPSSSKSRSKPKSSQKKKKAAKKKPNLESSDLPKENASVSTEENDLPGTDCDGAEDSPNELAIFDMF